MLRSPEQAEAKNDPFDKERERYIRRPLLPFHNIRVRSMHFKFLTHWGLTALLFCGFVIAGCEDDPVEPDDTDNTYSTASQDIGDGSAKLYVTLDDNGDPMEIGIRITESALQGLPTEDPPISLWFDVPTEGNAMVIDHVSLDWNPHGHEPETIFTEPHFDMHFYMMTEAERLAIDPNDINFSQKQENLPPAEYIPTDYVVPGPPGASPEATPAMGVHLVDSKDASIMPGGFTEVLIYGAWDGELTFIEPMMTKAWLDGKPTLQETLKLPQKYQQNGFYPTTYNVSFDAATNEYVITLGGMVERQAS